jgi:hypothetical protein
MTSASPWRSSGTSAIETNSSGEMAKRISSCTQPYRSAPPPIKALAKSACSAVGGASSMPPVHSSMGCKQTNKSKR